MAVGFRVRNQSTGLIQIADGYTNLQLTKSGVLDTGTFLPGSTGGSPPSVNGGSRGLLASTNGTTNLHVIRYVNDNVAPITGFTIVQSNVLCYIYASTQAANKSLEYYTFNASTTPASGPVGLRLKNENGAVYYDSRRKSLRVLHVITLPEITGLPILIGQYSVGTKIGIAIPSPRFYYNSVSQDRCTMSADHFHMTSDNRIYGSRSPINSQILLSNTYPIGGATMGPQNATIFIVDLSEVPLNFTA